MAKSKVIKSAKDEAEGGQVNLDGANHNLNGQGLQQAGFSKNGDGASDHGANGHSANGSLVAAAEAKGTNNPVLAEKIKDLIRLAQEQGYLTYGDINDALPDNMASPEEM